MRRAFTLIEVMVVLSVLAIIAILAYNFFGGTIKEASLKQMAVQLGKDMATIENTYHEYMRITGSEPDLSSDAARATYKQAVVDLGIVRQWPVPHEDWLNPSGTCASTRSPGGPLGWFLGYTNYAGDATADFAYYMFCLRPDLCAKFNELYTDLGATTNTSHTEAEWHGGRLCYMSGDVNEAIIFGLGDIR